MRLGLLHHKDPTGPVRGADLARLRGLSTALGRLGVKVALVAPIPTETVVFGSIPALPLAALSDAGRFDLVKACWHFSLEHAHRWTGPLVCRLVRVVDEERPARDEALRTRLLACQEIAARRAAGLVFNNRENVRRWIARHGRGRLLALAPPGCPAEIPLPRPSAWSREPPSALFLGSLAAPRMVDLLNEAADRLEGEVEVQFIGRNKSGLYGRETSLSPLVRQLGEIDEDAVWDHIHRARVGLAFAAGPDPFDNDLAKIWTYLRGGLPVLGEEGLANAWAFLDQGFGLTFRCRDPADLAVKVRLMCAAEVGEGRGRIAAWAAAQHSWDVRAAGLLRFFRRVLSRR